MTFVSIAVPFDDRWYFAELVRGAEEALRDAGHDLRVHVVPPSDTAAVAATAAISADFQNPDALGAIAAGFKYAPSERPRVMEWERPIVVIGGSVLGFPTVMIDDINAGLTATEHLIRLGHRRITLFTGPLDHQMDFHVDGRRARGYRTAMDQAGLTTTVVETAFDSDEVYRHAQSTLAAPSPPTAVFATSDEIAIPVLTAIHDAGLRPGLDVSVIGIDDHPDAEKLDLTTLRQRPAEMSAAAVQMILNGLSKGPDPTRSRLFPTTLITRGSTSTPSRQHGDR